MIYLHIYLLSKLIHVFTKSVDKQRKCKTFTFLTFNERFVNKITEALFFVPNSGPCDNRSDTFMEPFYHVCVCMCALCRVG